MLQHSFFSQCSPLSPVSAICCWHWSNKPSCSEISSSRESTFPLPATNPLISYLIPVSSQKLITNFCNLRKLWRGTRGNKWCTAWNCKPPWIQSSHSGQATSIVVRSWRWGKDSVSPSEAVGMPQCDSVIWTWSGIVIMWLTKTKAILVGQSGKVRQTRQYPNQNQ